MKETNHNFQVSGTGHTRNEAMQKAFSSMRKELNELELGYLVHAHPIEVKILSEQQIKNIEKFMFFFFPREKNTFEIVLNIKVNIKYI